MAAADPDAAGITGSRRDAETRGAGCAVSPREYWRAIVGHRLKSSAAAVDVCLLLLSDSVVLLGETEDSRRVTAKITLSATNECGGTKRC